MTNVILLTYARFALVAIPKLLTVVALENVYVYVLPTVIPVLTDEPLTLSVNVPVSEPYLTDVILIAVTLLLAAVTGTAVKEPTALLVPNLTPDFPVYALLTALMELIKALEETALLKKLLVVKALVPSLEAVLNATAQFVPVVVPPEEEPEDVTVTAHVAVAVPHFAVIVALPAALAVTVPPLTVATEELLVDQETVPPLAVAVQVEELPTVNDNDDLFKETEQVVVEPPEVVVLLVAQFHLEEPQQQFANAG